MWYHSYGVPRSRSSRLIPLEFIVYLVGVQWRSHLVSWEEKNPSRVIILITEGRWRTGFDSLPYPILINTVDRRLRGRPHWAIFSTMHWCPLPMTTDQEGESLRPWIKWHRIGDLFLIVCGALASGASNRRHAHGRWRRTSVQGAGEENPDIAAQFSSEEQDASRSG